MRRSESRIEQSPAAHFEERLGHSPEPPPPAAGQDHGGVANTHFFCSSERSQPRSGARLPTPAPGRWSRERYTM